jgi:acylaminoacyl-peptidase
MIKQIIDEKLCDKNKVIVIGGSYGGFIGGIMAARYADIYKCAILLNPALNLPFMLNTTGKIFLKRFIYY